MTDGALRAATFALFAIAASAAMPGALRAQDFACDRGEQEVRFLEFRGNRAVSDDDLERRVGTTPSSRLRRVLGFVGVKRCLDRDQLPADIENIIRYYRERGFYSTKVDTLVQTLSPSAVRVVFLIEEGQPTIVRSYEIAGLEGIPGAENVQRGLRLRVGEPFDFGLFRSDIDSIVRRLRNTGYYRADVLHEYRIDYDSLTAYVSNTVMPGARARFGEPQFLITPVEDRGQQISNQVVRRVLGIPVGAFFSDRAIVEAQRNLFQLGAYRHIEVAPLPDSLQPPGDTVVVLLVRLTEDYMKQLDSEIGWATLDCVRTRLQYTDRNWLKTARRLELTGSASKIGYGDPLQSAETRRMCTFGNATELKDDQFSDTLHYFVGATARQPRLLGTRWVPALSVYSERRGEFRAFLRKTRIGGDLSATRDVGERMPFRLAYTFEYGETDAEPAAFCALFNRCDAESRSRLSVLAPLGIASAALVRNRTDNVISPTAGYVARAELRTSASRLLGTDDSLYFNKATGDVAWYKSTGGGNVFTVRLRGGAVLGRRLRLSDPTGFIPPQERLYAGGATSVRGFQQNELGALVYIARNNNVVIDSIVAGTDTVYQFEVDTTPGNIQSPDRAVPLGGNSLVVANIEYRLRDPFFFPNLLQYAIFLDGGDVWTRGQKPAQIKWTPGLGFRALTPVGPVQINVGYNPYQREDGPVYFNPDVRTLACATPGNTITYRRDPTGQLVEASSGTCEDYKPPKRDRFIQRLTFTFSIGPDF
jgi:outer membrane protein insertion porin family/translocation and assembly module TamA